MSNPYTKTDIDHIEFGMSDNYQIVKSNRAIAYEQETANMIAWSAVVHKYGHYSDFVTLCDKIDKRING